MLLTGDCLSIKSSLFSDSKEDSSLILTSIEEKLNLNFQKTNSFKGCLSDEIISSIIMVFRGFGYGFSYLKNKIGSLTVGLSLTCLVFLSPITAGLGSSKGSSSTCPNSSIRPVRVSRNSIIPKMSPLLPEKVL